MTDTQFAAIRQRSNALIADFAAADSAVPQIAYERAVLVDEVDRLRSELSRVQEEANASLRALAAGIRELHYVHPFNVGVLDPDRQYCDHDGQPWPCPTYRLVASLIEPTSGRAT